MLRQRHLHRHRDPSGLEVVPRQRLDGGDLQAAMAIDLAALGCEPHLGEPRIAGHHLEVDTRERPEHAGIDGRAGRRPGRAHHHLAAPEVGERAQVLGPEAAGRDFRIEAAEPVERPRIEFCVGRIDQRLDGGDRIDDADHRAVARGDAGEIRGRLQRAGARHVLDHDVGIARHMAPEMARENAQVELEGRAGRVADHGLHGAPAIEGGDRVRLRGRRCRQRDRHGQREREAARQTRQTDQRGHRRLHQAHRRRATMARPMIQSLSSSDRKSSSSVKCVTRCR